MISLIISYYKRLDFLDLILQSVDKQSYRHFEVIVAEDNNDPGTVQFVNNARSIYSFDICHVFHEDIGFRKTRILNKALRVAKGDRIVFIDGDCILHRHFLKEYSKSIKENNFCYGRRLFCSKKHTEVLLKSNSVRYANVFYAMLTGGKSIGAGFYLPFKKNIDKQHRRILGCNWGILKCNILKVNGFDEDYNCAGVGEDFDVDWRLKKIGLKVKSMKGKAIVFHLYHEPNYKSSDTEYVENLMAEKKKIGKSFCVNGLNQD
jgi:glycosyltransferase involved in cell wall biosynthesis